MIKIYYCYDKIIVKYAHILVILLLFSVIVYADVHYQINSSTTLVDLANTISGVAEDLNEFGRISQTRYQIRHASCFDQLFAISFLYFLSFLSLRG